MILEKGQYGIKDIINDHTKSSVDKIMVNRYIHVDHCFLKNGGVVYGNYKIICNDIEDANRLFEIIDDIFNGSRQEKLERILKED